MRRLALLAGLGAGLLGGCRVDARFETLHEDQRSVVDPAQIETVTLPNGLRVALLHDPRAQVASVDLRFEVGVADDPATAPGLALLLGQVLAAAPMADRSGGVPADVELTSALAIDLDRTDLASTMFDVDGALELAARRVETTCEHFTPELLATARERALATLGGVPPALVTAVWGAGHPYGHSLGDPRALAAATPQALCAFYQAHYGPASATLVVTGAFDANFMVRVRARFGRIARTQLAPRVAIPALPVAAGHQRIAVWGLAKPAAALAFPMPAQGADDEVMAELAVREVQTWDKALHVTLVGGRRGRALVMALEGDRESDLPHLHDKLRDLVDRPFTVGTTDRSTITSEDTLGAAQDLDDPFRRGAQLADLVATGRPLQRLARAKAFVDAHVTYHWMRLHVMEATPRVLDLIPGTPTGTASIEVLADAASGADRGLAPASTPMPPVPVRAIARPIADYTLANGLRVVLAPDRLATTIDARIVFPIGSRDEPEPGTATQAAMELESTDDVDYDAGQKLAWYAQRDSIQSADVTPFRTRLRVVGFAGLADWHVWALAFRVTTGRFEHGSGALARWKAHYVPRGATLIVSGGFDPAAIRKVVATWFGPWRTVDAKPVVHADRPAAPVVELAGDGTLDLELAYQLPAAAKTSRAAALVLANIAQLRLGDATRGVMDPAVTYDVSDRRLVIASQADPEAEAQALGLVDRELARLRDEAPTAAELERAARITVALRLGAELGASGRARELEERVLSGAPLDRPDPLVAEVTALTPEDLRAAAAELFDRARRSVALRASKADGDRVLATLGIDPKTAQRR